MDAIKSSHTSSEVLYLGMDSQINSLLHEWRQEMNPAAERERLHKLYLFIYSAFIVQETMPEWAGNVKAEVVPRAICIMLLFKYIL